MIDILQSPGSSERIIISGDGKLAQTESGSASYPIYNNVISFLKAKDEFYEGAYLNRVRFLPKSGSLIGKIGLWVINGGYMHTVKKTFPPGSKLLELGCAAGVDYFGATYSMVGLDLSLQSLEGLSGYQLALQADATLLPIRDGSLDGILSSYFWEHIPPDVKDRMLTEFARVLKPGGKLVFLYDVETDNSFIALLKKKNIQLYNKLFLDGDGHFGYETPDANRRRFESASFRVTKHFGMERSWLQSNSVYEKYRHLSGIAGFIGKLMYTLTKGKVTGYLHIAFIRLFDETIGRLFPLRKSRIIITVAEK